MVNNRIKPACWDHRVPYHTPNGWAFFVEETMNWSDSHATPNQLAFLHSLLEQIPAEEAYEYQAYLADEGAQPTKQWASDVIEGLKKQIGKTQSQGKSSEAQEKRLAARAALKESPTERIQRIYRGAWRLQGLSMEGFDQRWAEIGDPTLAFHGERSLS